MTGFTVTQADREAAAALIEARPLVDNIDIIKHGGADDSGFVQAFARRASEATAEKDALIAEARGWFEAILRQEEHRNSCLLPRSDRETPQMRIARQAIARFDAALSKVPVQ